MIQTAGLRNFSETTVSVHFLILRRVIGPIACVQTLVLDSLPPLCITGEFFQCIGYKRRSRILGKKILFYCVIQCALFSI